MLIPINRYEKSTMKFKETMQITLIQEYSINDVIIHAENN